MGLNCTNLLEPAKSAALVNSAVANTRLPSGVMSHAQYEPTPQAPPPWPAQAPVQGRSQSRLLPILGAALGLLGLIVGVAAWFRAAPSNVATNPLYSEQQVADAKQAVCEAYAKGMRSIRTVGSVKVDPQNWFPTAVNTRLAGFAVGTYFFDSLNANPATPSELYVLVQQVGEAYRDIALTQLADGTPLDYRSSNDTVQELVP